MFGARRVGYNVAETGHQDVHGIGRVFEGKFQHESSQKRLVRLADAFRIRREGNAVAFSQSKVLVEVL